MVLFLYKSTYHHYKTVWIFFNTGDLLQHTWDLLGLAQLLVHYCGFCSLLSHIFLGELKLTNSWASSTCFSAELANCFLSSVKDENKNNVQKLNKSLFFMSKQDLQQPIQIVQVQIQVQHRTQQWSSDYLNNTW